jgi:hypothetical protein
MEYKGPKYIADKLKDLTSKGLKVESLKKFRSYEPAIQLTLLNLCENIGKVVGLENVVLEPSLPSGDADIKFVNEDVYFLQVKSPLFLRGKYGRQFIEISREFDEILSERSRFAIGYVVREYGSQHLIPIHVKDIDKQGRKASVGILIFDDSFISIDYSRLKFADMLIEANRQLRRIREKGWKVFILDITNYPTKGTFDLFVLLRSIFSQYCNVLDAIDGLGLFSWDPMQRNGITISSTIIPARLKERVRSKVFKRTFHLYRGLMIALPTVMYVHGGQWNELFTINRSGIWIDGTYYGPFWDFIKLFSYY